MTNQFLSLLESHPSASQISSAPYAPAAMATKWIESPVGSGCGVKPGVQVILKPFACNRRKFLLQRTSYTFGSGAGADFILTDPFLSKRHLRIHLQPDGFYHLEDLGSKNGVVLNGTRVKNAILPKKGTIRMGRSILEWDGNSIPLSGAEFFSVKMRELMAQAQIAASTKVPILILGETGVGKEVLAKKIHDWSERSSWPFVEFNSAAVHQNLIDSELFGHKKGAFTGAEENRTGALASAHRGTLFLDELGEMPLESQGKLLRVLETGEIKSLGSDQSRPSDFRIIAATNAPLEDLVREGRFRMDLYFRLCGFVLRVPPLRERSEEIWALAQKFAGEEGMIIEESAKAILQAHAWVGNIRELKSAVYRGVMRARRLGSMVVAEEMITLDSQLLSERRDFEPMVSLEALERQAICNTLRQTGGSKSMTAKILGIARSTLFEKMRRYSIYL